MSPVSQGAGKRRAVRRKPRRRLRLDARALLYAGGVTFCVIAWGYLVLAAIDFGTSARSGHGSAWLFLAVSCLGAACCLFAGLMIGTRLLVAIGAISPSRTHETDELAPPPRPVGGRRVAR
jgi:hypothetical protein